MSAFIKNALRLPAVKSIGGKLWSPSPMKPVLTRNIWHLSNNLERNSCGCGFNAKFHNKGGFLSNRAAAQSDRSSAGEKELAEFLVEEIAAEKKLQKTKIIPTEVDGFKVELDGSEVSLIKTSGDETIEINFNINHSVDSDVDPDVDPSADKPELGEMKCKPTFEVEIKRGGKTLGFTCSFVTPSGEVQQESGFNDIFAIDEVVMYDGEWKDNNYSVAGDVIDGTLYDLFMNLLEDKGITNEFVDKLSEFSTSYEHNRYISMLETIQKFVQK